MNTPNESNSRKAPWFLAAAGVAACFFAAGCNTVDGAGEDLQEASSEVEDAIDD